MVCYECWHYTQPPSSESHLNNPLEREKFAVLSRLIRCPLSVRLHSNGKITACRPCFQMHSDAFRTNSYRAIANHSLLLVVLLIITFPQLRSLALEMPSIQYIPFSHPLTYHVWSRDRVASTSGIQPSAVYPFWNTSCTCPARC